MFWKKVHLRLPVKWVAILFTLAFSLPKTEAAPGRVALPGQVPTAVQTLVPKGMLPESSTVWVSIGLPVRDPAGLHALLRDLYDPQSPNFRKFIRIAEFAGRFGPLEKEYEEVKDFAIAAGLRVAAVHQNRLVLDVEGSPSQIEKAFGTRLQVYRHPTEERDFFSPQNAPSVPANLSVAAVEGLTDY